MTTWAEDRATVGTDPSADPGAKTEGRAADPLVDRPSLPFPSGLAQSDEFPAAQPRAISRLPPAKVARISGRKWPRFPERAAFRACGGVVLARRSQMPAISHTEFPISQRLTRICSHRNGASPGNPRPRCAFLCSWSPCATNTPRKHLRSDGFRAMIDAGSTRRRCPMRAHCSRCGHESKRRAQYCGHCGNRIMHAIQPVHSQQPVRVVAHPVSPIVPSPERAELAAHMQLEMATRLNPLMNRERLKAMVMAISAQGGTGTVGFWCDD